MSDKNKETVKLGRNGPRCEQRFVLQSAGSWVPTSERMPKTYGHGLSDDVLITAELCSEGRSVDNTIVAIDRYDAQSGGWYDHDKETWRVTAWCEIIPFQQNKQISGSGENA